MRKELRLFEPLMGDWSGRGTTRRDVPVNVRVLIRPRMAGEAVEIAVDSLHVSSNKLVHGVVGLVSARPDGRVRMAAASTIHGAFLMDTTPEDPGAVAFEGRSVPGNHVVVSFVADGPDLLLTAQWRPDTSGTSEPVGMTNCRLRRVITSEEE